MKKFLLFCFILIGFLILANQKASYVYGIYETDTAKAIKSITYEFVKQTYMNNKWVCLYKYISEKQVYDEAGRLVELVRYYPDGRVLSRHEYKYGLSEDGKTIRVDIKTYNENTLINEERIIHDCYGFKNDLKSIVQKAVDFVHGYDGLAVRYCNSNFVFYAKNLAKGLFLGKSKDLVSQDKHKITITDPITMKQYTHEITLDESKRPILVVITSSDISAERTFIAYNEFGYMRMITNFGFEKNDLNRRNYGPVEIVYMDYEYHEN